MKDSEDNGKILYQMENCWILDPHRLTEESLFFGDAVWQDHEFLIRTLTFEFNLNRCLYQ